MSHRAIAAVLARTDLSMGERLVALSLASFTNREDRAFPGNAAAAARAGLSRSRYLEAREQLVARGLVAIEEVGRGRGHATTLTALFAQFGPWWDGEINARLLEHVLTQSPARGPARLLLATLAAIADESGVVDQLSTDELSRAAGLANSTYRRARAALLACDEVEIVDDGGGRGRMNRWRVLARATELTTSPVRPRRRRAPPRGQPPLLSAVRPELTSAVSSRPTVGVVSRQAEKGPGRERGFRAKGSGRDRGFGTKGSGPERGIAGKGSGRERGFRRKRRQNPARNPATPRARGKGTPEPRNQ